MPEQFIQYIPFLSSFLAPAIIIIVFVLLFKKRNQLLDLERGMVPIHKENCGGKFNYTNFSRPFVRLALYNDFMIISYFKQILLNYHEIEKVEYKNQWGQKYIQIFHRKADAPKKILLITKNAEQISQIINQKLSNYVQPTQRQT
ncbi:MAG: hypothetical protein WC862_01010 [Patescibacteria group bacterium]